MRAVLVFPCTILAPGLVWKMEVFKLPLGFKVSTSKVFKDPLSPEKPNRPLEKSCWQKMFSQSHFQGST